MMAEEAINQHKKMAMGKMPKTLNSPKVGYKKGGVPMKKMMKASGRKK
jgi:hypothetical protein